MAVKLGDTIVIDFATKSPTTGSAAAPDSVSVSVFEDTTAAAIYSPTPDVRTGLTGANFVAVVCTSGNGFENGKSYNVYATAVFGSITQNKIIGTFQIANKGINDLKSTYKNVAVSNFMFMMTSSTTGAAATGLTVTAQRSIDGAAFASCANSVTELSNGIYKINLASTDLNGDVITLRFTATGANDRTITILTN